MTKPIAWSWSRLDTFEACPLQFYHKNVIKSVPFVQNDAMKRGERLHAHLENALKSGTVHEEISHMAPTIEKLRGVSWDECLIEVDVAYNEDKRPVSWFGKDVWVRIKQDFMAKRGDRAVSIDFKSGKNRGYSDQLKLYAGVAMHMWQDVEEVITSYVFIDSNQKEEKRFRRDDYEHIWQEFGERAERIQIANESGEWPAKPSAMACRFCPVRECDKRR